MERGGSLGHTPALPALLRSLSPSSHLDLQVLPPYPTSLFPCPAPCPAHLCQAPNLDVCGGGMEGLPHESFWKLPKGKHSVSLKPGLLEACVPDPSRSSAQPGLAPRGPEVSQLLLSVPTKSLLSSLCPSLLQILSLSGNTASPRLAGFGGTTEETGVCCGLGRGGRRSSVWGPPLGGGGGAQMEQSPPVTPSQLQTEGASPSNRTVGGWEEGGGWESGAGNNDIINYP